MALSDDLIPFERFILMERAEITSQFYSQSWATVHYLMEVHPLGRFILFDYISAQRNAASGSGMASGASTSLADILGGYSITLDSFVDGMIAHYQGRGT